MDDVELEVINGKITVLSTGCSHSNTTDVPAKESTCEEQGNNAYTKCNDCGEITSGSDAKLPFADHNYTQTVDDKYLASAATCTAKAKYYESCSVCGEKSNKTFESGEVNTDNHKLVEVKAKKETHEENGNIAYFDCTACEKYFTDADAKNEIALADTVIAKGEHDYGTTYKSDAKNHWKECDCESVIEKAAHTFGEWVVTKEATKTESGSKERTCSVCEYKVTQRIPATYRPIFNNNNNTTKPNSATGGDNNTTILWIVFVTVSAVAFAGTVIFRKRRAK